MACLLVIQIDIQAVWFTSVEVVKGRIFGEYVSKVPNSNNKNLLQQSGFQKFWKILLLLRTKIENQLGVKKGFNSKLV